MNNIIAMAGLAEAAEFYSFLIFSGILFAVVGLFALAWTKRWWAAALIGCLVCLMIGFLLQPWTQFAPPTTDDPDEAWRLFSVFWVAIFVGGVACLTAIFRRRNSNS
jgi:O-antigen/teichoic acid export membrane protein